MHPGSLFCTLLYFTNELYFGSSNILVFDRSKQQIDSTVSDISSGMVNLSVSNLRPPPFTAQTLTALPMIPVVDQLVGQQHIPLGYGPFLEQQPIYATTAVSGHFQNLLLIDGNYKKSNIHPNSKVFFNYTDSVHSQSRMVPVAPVHNIYHPSKVVHGFSGSYSSVHPQRDVGGSSDVHTHYVVQGSHDIHPQYVAGGYPSTQQQFVVHGRHDIHPQYVASSNPAEHHQYVVNNNSNFYHQCVVGGNPTVHQQYVASDNTAEHQQYVVGGNPTIQQQYVVGGNPTEHNQYFVSSNPIKHQQYVVNGNPTICQQHVSRSTPTVLQQCVKDSNPTEHQQCAASDIPTIQQQYVVGDIPTEHQQYVVNSNPTIYQQYVSRSTPTVQPQYFTKGNPSTYQQCVLRDNSGVHSQYVVGDNPESHMQYRKKNELCRPSQTVMITNSDRCFPSLMRDNIQYTKPVSSKTTTDNSQFKKKIFSCKPQLLSKCTICNIIKPGILDIARVPIGNSSHGGTRINYCFDCICHGKWVSDLLNGMLGQLAIENMQKILRGEPVDKFTTGNHSGYIKLRELLEFCNKKSFYVGNAENIPTSPYNNLHIFIPKLIECVTSLLETTYNDNSYKINVVLIKGIKDFEGIVEKVRNNIKVFNCPLRIITICPAYLENDYFQFLDSEFKRIYLNDWFSDFYEFFHPAVCPNYSAEQLFNRNIFNDENKEYLFAFLINYVNVSQTMTLLKESEDYLDFYTNFWKNHRSILLMLNFNFTFYSPKPDLEKYFLITLVPKHYIDKCLDSKPKNIALKWYLKDKYLEIIRNYISSNRDVFVSNLITFVATAGEEFKTRESMTAIATKTGQTDDELLELCRLYYDSYNKYYLHKKEELLTKEKTISE